jgi:queuine tRNA-ribosyltransferase
MTDQFAFRVAARDGDARTGEIQLPRGVIRTPAFMPVGTAGTVKAMLPETVRGLGSDVILANTYHLMVRPGAERVAALGGLHAFANWPWPILTDSGGFQVLSLAKLRRVDDDGVTFQSHLDGALHRLTPERAMEIQALLDSDIRMQLDELVPLPAARADLERAVARSSAWAERSKAAFAGTRGRAAFGIVQGGDVADLRRRSAESLAAIGFDGYAIGGLAVGEPQATMLAMIEATVVRLPGSAPRYLMGVGTPQDIVEAVARGIDMFDCVLPTRAGRHGIAYTRFGKLNLKNARHAEDRRPLDEESDCPASRDYSRGYLQHLVKSGEILGAMLLTWNNLAYYQALMAGLRKAIAAGRMADFRAAVHDDWARGDREAA